MSKAEKAYTVYAVRNSITGRMYVGCTNNVENRIQTHFLELRTGRKTCQVLYPQKTRTKTQWQLDYNEHGPESFKFYVLETGISKEHKAERELFWIEKYDALNPKHGYNLRGPGKKARAVCFEDGLPPMPEDGKKGSDAE